MHYDSVVVSLTDEKKKPFREVDSKKTPDGRRCTVHMPFDSEYKLLVKNLLKSQRLRLEIDIDGTNVSGTGLVIEADEAAYIERFVDIAKKFKFVKAQGAGACEDVADPTNPENGIIKIRVHREKPMPKPPKILREEHHHHHHHDHWPYQQPLIWTNVGPVFGSSSVNYSDENIQVKSSGNVDIEAKGLIDNSCNSLRSFGPSGPKGDPGPTMDFFCASDVQVNHVQTEEDQIGATVEGKHSYQNFGYTEWQGDSGKPIVFSFKVVGIPSPKSLKDDPEYQEFLRLQEKFGKSA